MVRPALCNFDASTENTVLPSNTNKISVLEGVFDNSISPQFRRWENRFKLLVQPNEIPTDWLCVSGF